MRSSTIYLFGAAIAALPMLLLAMSSSANAQYGVAAQSCPAGQHWENAGYVAEGKWRAAGCYKNGGRE